MILSPADKDSQLWQRIKAHLTDRLEKLRLQNDGRMTESQRSEHIGRIMEVKAILQWEHSKPGERDE